MSEWIPDEDEIDHMFVLNYGETYLITLEVQSATESASTSAWVEVGSQYVTYPKEVESALEITEEPSKYKTFYDGFPPEIKNWFADRNQMELIIISLAVIGLVAFFGRRKKQYRHYILKRRKNE